MRVLSFEELSSFLTISVAERSFEDDDDDNKGTKKSGGDDDDEGEQQNVPDPVAPLELQVSLSLTSVNPDTKQGFQNLIRLIFNTK